MTVEATTHVPDMIRTLRGTLADHNAHAAQLLATDLRESVPDDAPAAEAQRAGVYIRTANSSGYSQAAQAVRQLFSGSLESLFAGSLTTLFVGAIEDVFAGSLQQLADPRIVPEVAAPPDTGATVASATGWSQARHWQSAIGRFDMDDAYSGLIEEWLRRSGV